MEVLKKTILRALTTGTTQGYWNALFNVPNLSGVQTVGDMWYVAVAGNTSLGGINDWEVGDWAIKYDGGWGKVIIDTYNYTGSTTDILAIPDFSVDYVLNMGLKQPARDLGFFDAYLEPTTPPEPPIPPEPTFYLTDNEPAYEFVDDNNDNFIYE